MQKLKTLLGVGNASEAFLEVVHESNQTKLKAYTKTVELATVLDKSRSQLLKSLQADGLRLPLQKELEDCGPMVRASEADEDVDTLIELVGLVADHDHVKQQWATAQNGPVAPTATLATPTKSRTVVRSTLGFNNPRTPVSEEKASHKGGALLAAACWRFERILEDLVAAQDLDDSMNNGDGRGTGQTQAEQKEIRHASSTKNEFGQAEAALKMRFKLGASIPLFEIVSNGRGRAVGKSVEDLLEVIEQTLKIPPDEPVGDMTNLLLALLERFLTDHRDMLKSLRAATQMPESASTYSYLAACMSGSSFTINLKAELAQCKEVKSNAADNVADVIQSLEFFRNRVREYNTMAKILQTGMEMQILAEVHIPKSTAWIKDYIQREILVDTLFGEVKGITATGMLYIDEVIRTLGLRKTAQGCQLSPTKPIKKDKEDKVKTPKVTRKVNRRDDSSSESEEEVAPRRKNSRRGDSRQTGTAESKTTENKPRQTVAPEQNFQEQPQAEWINYTVDGRRICWFNNTTRGCVKGDECDFVHDDSAPKVGSNVCWDFDSKGYCRFGERCRFEHTDKGHEILREWEARQPAPTTAAIIPVAGLHQERRDMVQEAAKGGGKGSAKGGGKGGGKGGKQGGSGKGGGKNRQ
jgi:hypothetical protein